MMQFNKFTNELCVKNNFYTNLFIKLVEMNMMNARYLFYKNFTPVGPVFLF